HRDRGWTKVVEVTACRRVVSMVGKQWKLVEDPRSLSRRSVSDDEERAEDVRGITTAVQVRRGSGWLPADMAGPITFGKHREVDTGRPVSWDGERKRRPTQVSFRCGRNRGITTRNPVRGMNP